MTLVAGLLEAFFSDRLLRQRNASPNTVAAYRDTFRMLLVFAQERLRKPPTALLLAELDAKFIVAFLQHLEKQRRNSVRTRNARLAAIHSFFRFVALQEPAHTAAAQRVLAIPTKKMERKLITSLTRAEQEALLAAPKRNTWLGRRDHAIIMLLLQTGLRVSELRGLRCEDVVLATGAHVRCRGKGRKERCTPLTRETVSVLRAWLTEREGLPVDPAFPSRRGAVLSRDAVERLVAKYAGIAGAAGSSLRTKRVTPHVLRHTTAVSLLQAGNDRAVIALWLGHESIETTQMYLDADLSMKERALARTAPLRSGPGRYRPDDSLLAFLSEL
ncbi:MAG TPA: tyrosine-type recombinase/integrase [Kofleriaceae bacterium]